MYHLFEFTSTVAICLSLSNFYKNGKYVSLRCSFILITKIYFVTSRVRIVIKLVIFSVKCVYCLNGGNVELSVIIYK